METYDDRPISVYDNMSNMPASNAMHTSTPKAKPHQTQTTAAAAAAPTTSPTSPTSSSAAMANGEATTPRSPYVDIAFKFNDNSNKQQQPQSQQQQQQQHLLPNGNQQSSNQSQVHPNPNNVAYAYATPYKSTTATPAATTTTASPPLASLLTANTTPTTTTTTNTNTPPPNVSPAQRPLSQHSQSELSEVRASQSIAAVKAALNDAKSKFFGLNGYAPNSSPNNSNAESQPSSLRLLPAEPQQHPHHHKPKVQIVTPTPSPPAKPQPKYQNIPENSAIFRKQAPELPPKPSQYQHSPVPGIDFNDSHAASPSPASSSPLSGRISSEPKMSAPSSIDDRQSPAKSLPYAAYQQLPLNDIDISQPSQAVYMSTTVPQNIKGAKIAGRHTPTRNSLRHSRMLVVNNKNYQGMQHPNPMNFKHPNLARWLLILQIILGLLISFLAIWIAFLAPNTAIQDNPYWSGLALLLAGILGLVLVRYQRIKRHKVRENCFVFLRADSYLLSLVAVLFCCVAIACAALDFARLTAGDTKCVSTNPLLEEGSCTCTFNSLDVPAAPASITHFDSNGLLDEEEHIADFEDRSYKVEYRDLSCQEVNGEWISILGLSMTLNSLGFLVALLYIILLVCCRQNDKRLYASVHSSTF